MKHKITFLGLITAIVFIDFSVHADDSPVRVFKGNGHSYQLIDQIVTWPDARDLCKSKGGYLSTITGPKENQFITTSFILSPEILGWLGGSDLSEAGTWKWLSNNESFIYKNWAANVDGQEGQFIALSNAGTWYHIPGSGELPFFNSIHTGGVSLKPICEWDASDVTVFPASGIVDAASAFDASITVFGKAKTLNGGKLQILLNSVDVTAACSPAEVLLDTAGISTVGQVMRCPGLSEQLVKPGENVLDVTFTDAKKKKSTDAVEWIVYPTPIQPLP